MRYKKSVVSVGQIVEASIRVLARQGYANTSLMDIAKEVGMSKGAVHYHFPTKEALMTHVLQTACNAVAQRTQSALGDGVGPEASLRTALRELWRVRAELPNETKVVADLMTQALHDSTLRKPLAEYYQFAFDQVQQHITGSLAALGLRPRVAPELLPRLLHALLDGLLIQRIVDPDSLDDDEVVDALETLAASLFEFEGPSADTPDNAQVESDGMGAPTAEPSGADAQEGP